ncbi:cysteine/glutathione ABC transporter permease/ATP-binding protein CydD [Vibrio sp.]|nr:cysteine/glutathione ABC transporter permease/ATP-binding protein CydD [Vibrio sp.]
MDKKAKRNLNKWLKSQSQRAKKWLMLSIGLGVLSSLALVGQAALLASILHDIIIENINKHTLIPEFLGLAGCITLRALLTWAREVTGFRCGEQVRIYIRQIIFDKLHELGPAYIKGKPAGSWATLILEQVDNMHDFFAKYLPQMTLAVLIPLVILAVVFPVNWAVALILLITAPLVPLFMALAGMKAAEANRKNFKALQRLSGHFYDRLQSMTTIRLFNQADKETQVLHEASEVFRNRTMDVLKMAFLSSAILEFFTSISIAIAAVYFGFSFIGELDFGHYGVEITLFTGLFILILAPEFYQPLRDLGTFYHAKQQAIGAAESIVFFLKQDVKKLQGGSTPLPPLHENINDLNNNTLKINGIEIIAENLHVFTPEGTPLLGPISFSLTKQQQTALVGPSGAGKTTLINTLLGFLPYEGSLKINGIELTSLNLADLRDKISWVGQNPLLLHGNIYDNVTLGKDMIREDKIDNHLVEQALKKAYASEFTDEIGLDYPISDRSGGLSVGQAQRIALARAILQDGLFWVLDEPTASLDSNSEQLIMKSINEMTQHTTTLIVTHQLSQLESVDQILVLDKGKLVESGTFKSLLEQSGLFSSMYTTNQQLIKNNQGNLDA